MTTTDNRTHDHEPATVPPHQSGRAPAASVAPAAELVAGPAPIPMTGPPASPVGGPVPVAWREGTLTRAKEIECLAYGLAHSDGSRFNIHLLAAIDHHLAAARQAATYSRRHFGRRMDAALLERAISNLDAAQANLLQMAPETYVLGQIPSLLNEVQRHLSRDDPRRQEFERIAMHLGVRPPDGSPTQGADLRTLEDNLRIVEVERSRIVSIARGANSSGLREQLRVRSFRTVLVISAGVMAMLAALLGLLGWISPAVLPLCFQSEQSLQLGQAGPSAICPTGQSGARPEDIAMVEVIGLIAASIASAAALRRIRGSSEPHGLPVALALLKLPTGALTAVLGLLLMRGEFLPGMSALDSPGQIIAWAIIFGYAQQLFTRFVDQQADSVLNEVRGSRTVGGPSA